MSKTIQNYIVVANTLGMDKTEWLKLRRNGIGGSDVGAILGVNKWSTAFKVYMDKVSTEEPENIENESMYWGTTLEDTVAKEFTKRTGKKVKRMNQLLQHKDYPFMYANLDRVVVGEKALLECKTADKNYSKEWLGEEVPASYLLQVNHYLAVTGYEKAYIAVLVGGNRFVWKEIQRDEELINMIIDAESDFWNNNVLANNPPMLDGSSAAEEMLKEKYQRANKGSKIELTSDYADKISRYWELKLQIDELETEQNEIKNQIKNELGENEAGVVGSWVATWKNQSKTSVDSATLKEKYPDIYKECSKTSSYRVFSIKEPL